MSQPHSEMDITPDFDSGDEGSNPSGAATSRRAFLQGLFGVAVVAALPSIPVVPPTYTLVEWQEAVIKVYYDLMRDTLIYGTGAIRSCDKFPFIECVPLSELYLPTTIGGLFDDR